MSFKRTAALKHQRLAFMLWSLLLLFILRVLGQLLVSLGCGWRLPPMSEWYSGLLAYPYLLASQLLIIILYAKVCLSFTRREGFFFRAPGRKTGTCLLIFGSIYFASMLLRYAITMQLYPARRWTSGTIPIFFHLILATFILLVGYAYHERPDESFEQLP